jgi:hypothetical protein
MNRLINKIKITQLGDGRSAIYEWFEINNIRIEKSWDKQTQTATILLPRNLKYNDKNIYEGQNPLLRRGDKVEIFGGYYPNLTPLFSGYISKIGNNVPVEILCEDEMFILKQSIAPNISYESVNLRTLIGKILENTNIPYEALDAQIGAIRTQKASVGLILQKLRTDYGLFSYFKNGKLRVGLAYYQSESNTETILFERQMIDTGNLRYLKKDDVKVKLEGVIIKSDNSREEYNYGDPTGELRTIFQYGGTKAELDLKANLFLEQMNYTGYYGSFLTFIEPKVEPGDFVQLDSYIYPERKGKYLVKSVTSEIGMGGGRQNIELERRIA